MAEVTAKTVDEAVKSALEQLDAQKDQVDIEIKDEGSKGIIFGIGARMAVVRVVVQETAQSRAVDFLDSVFEKMHLKVEVKFKRNGKYLDIELVGDDMAVIIGRRGETLDALQYITGLVANKTGDDFVYVSIDTENYRKKREETLARLSRRLAEKVIKTKKSVSLEPMNAQERRVIHATLQHNKYVHTQSVGEEPYRKIVISLGGSKGNSDFKKNTHTNTH